MDGNLSWTLPRFKMFNAFFADLKGDFAPTQLTETEKEVYRKSICSLVGWPMEEFMTLREDLEITAHVREARKYANGRSFVRYEFRRRCRSRWRCRRITSLR